MRGVSRNEAPVLWGFFLASCRGEIAETLREMLPSLYVYLGGECGWSPSELDRWTLGELTAWANARSVANERAAKG